MIVNSSSLSEQPSPIEKPVDDIHDGALPMQRKSKYNRRRSIVGVSFGYEEWNMGAHDSSDSVLFTVRMFQVGIHVGVYRTSVAISDGTDQKRTILRGHELSIPSIEYSGFIFVL